MPRGIARDHDAKRAALRIGAAKYFPQHGYERATMTGAAQACGVSKALLYHYHDSKEALLFDILNTHLSQVVTTAEQTAPNGLRPLISAILHSYADSDAAHRLQLTALPFLPSDMRQTLLVSQRRLAACMSQTLASDKPDLASDRQFPATMTVFGILNWIYIWHRPDKGLSRNAYADLAADFVEGGLSRLCPALLLAQNTSGESRTWTGTGAAPPLTIFI